MGAIPAAQLSLGLLAVAGGAHGQVEPVQVARLAGRFPGEVGPVLVACAPAQAARLPATVQPVPLQGQGGLAGLQALLAACTTPWLLVVPLDVLDLNDCLVRSLAAAVRAPGRDGALAVTAEGPQPWVALYRCQALAPALAQAVAAGEDGPGPLQRRLRLEPVALAGVRFGRPPARPLPPLLGPR